jgi:hypothetical protein
VIHSTGFVFESAFSFFPTASAARPPMPVSISSKSCVRWCAGSFLLRD